MNNKGFTLIELLGVLVILTTILLIAIPSVSSTLERKKEKDIIQKQEAIITASEVYASNNKKNINYDEYLNNTCCIEIDLLYDNSLITEEEYNAKKNYKCVKRDGSLKEDITNSCT